MSDVSISLFIYLSIFLFRITLVSPAILFTIAYDACVALTNIQTKGKYTRNLITYLCVQSVLQLYSRWCLFVNKLRTPGSVYVPLYEFSFLNFKTCNCIFFLKSVSVVIENNWKYSIYNPFPPPPFLTSKINISSIQV